MRMKKIQQHFKIKDLGPPARFLGCTISYHEKHRPFHGLENAIPMNRAYLGTLLTKQADPTEQTTSDTQHQRRYAEVVGKTGFPPKHNQTSRSQYQSYNNKLPSQHSKIHRPDGLVGFVDASQADCPDRHNSILMPSGHIMETPDVFIVENLGHGPPLPAPVAPDLYPPYCKATNRASLSSAVKRPAPTAVGEQLAPNPSPKHHPWPHLKWPEHHPRPNLKWPVLRPRLHLR
ncbi:hypothetical protein N7461_001547 [Penicillium sp. DV-2018c]|nr:hypothetical protein N7461_001547 [Penicillium sp. DV-2018c]